MEIKKIHSNVYSISKGDIFYGTAFWSVFSGKFVYSISTEIISLTENELYDIFVVISDLNKDLSYEVGT